MPLMHKHTRLMNCTALQEIVWWQCIFKTCYLLFCHYVVCRWDTTEHVLGRGFHRHGWKKFILHSHRELFHEGVCSVLYSLLTCILCTTLYACNKWRSVPLWIGIPDGPGESQEYCGLFEYCWDTSCWPHRRCRKSRTTPYTSCDNKWSMGCSVSCSCCLANQTTDCSYGGNCLRLSRLGCTEEIECALWQTRGVGMMW